MKPLLPPPIWVDNTNLFNQMSGDLSSQTRIAVDTESNEGNAPSEQAGTDREETFEAVVAERGPGEPPASAHRAGSGDGGGGSRGAIA